MVWEEDCIQLFEMSRMSRTIGSSRSSPFAKTSQRIGSTCARDELGKMCLRDGLINDLQKLVVSDQKQVLEISAQETTCALCAECNEQSPAGRTDCAALDRMEHRDDSGSVRCNKCQMESNLSQFKSVRNNPDLTGAIIKCDLRCNVASFRCGSNHLLQLLPPRGPLANNQSLFDPQKRRKREKIGQGQVCPGHQECTLGVPTHLMGKLGVLSSLDASMVARTIEKGTVHSRELVDWLNLKKPNRVVI